MPRGSQNIRRRRLAQGLSQLDLSLQIKVSVRTIQFAESGTVSISARMMEKIAEGLGLSYSEACLHVDVTEDDQFARLPWSLSRFIQQKASPGWHAFCHDSDSLLTVVQLMRDNWKLHLVDDGTEEAIEIFERGDRLLDERLTFYQDRYLSIWRENPECFQLATCDGVCSGLAIVLPVTDDAYRRFRHGEISFMDIAADDILPESQNLILDSATDFPGSGKIPWSRITDSLAYAVFCRIATLSKDPAADDFRMLSFGASRLNLNRLISLGFEDCRMEMPDFKFPVCEFSLDKCVESDGKYANASTTTLFARLIRPLNMTSAKSAITKRVVRAGLKALQRTIKHKPHSTLARRSHQVA